MNRDFLDRPTRKLLRAGDPATSELPMTNAEVAAMRRRLRSAIPAHQPARSRPALAAVAVVVTLIVGAFAMRPLRQPEPTPAPAPRVTQPAIEMPRTLAPRHTDVFTAQASLQPRYRLEHAPIESPVRTAAGGQRKLHFTAPNGTRIIWNLRRDNGPASRIDDGEARS